MTELTRAALCEMLTSERCFTPASVFDAVSARTAELSGHQIAMLPGSLVSAVVHGSCDIGVVTADDIVEQTRRICRNSALALIVDGEDGFGGPDATAELVGALGAAGAAAVTIEDAQSINWPTGKQVGLVSVEEAAAKIIAACEARSDTGPLIVARTRAPVLTGISDTLARADAYARAGADVLFLVGLQDLGHLKEIHEQSSLPLMLGGPGLAYFASDALAEAGVRVRILRHEPLPAVIRALLRVYDRSEGASPATVEELANKILLRTPAVKDTR